MDSRSCAVVERAAYELPTPRPRARPRPGFSTRWTDSPCKAASAGQLPSVDGSASSQGALDGQPARLWSAQPMSCPPPVRVRAPARGSRRAGRTVRAPLRARPSARSRSVARTPAEACSADAHNT